MIIDVTVLPNSSDTNSELRTLKKWSELTDQLDISEFSSASAAHAGSTLPQQEIYTPYLILNGVWVGDWSVNAQSVTISNADLQRIGAMQTADDFSVDAKMSHVTGAGSGKWGQAIMATYTPSSNWKAAVNIRMNQCPYGGNTVQVLERREMTVDTYGKVWMVRIKTGWDCVHTYTAVNRDNVHYEQVKGRIVLPLLARAGCEWWILERWLK